MLHASAAMSVSERIKGLLFVPFCLFTGYIFIVSGLIVCFCMLLTYVFVWPWNKTLYRRIVTSIGYTHWCQITFIAQWWSGSDVTFTTNTQDEFDKFGTEHTLLIMNHRTGIDWVVCWIFAERKRLLGGGKFIGKESLKWFPLLGWAWIFCENVFLKRKWDKDRVTIRKDLQFLGEYPKKIWVSILMFCEGTRFTESKHKKSLEFARKHNLPELKHHLLPRTKGFILCMHGLKGKKFGLLDMTMAFDKNFAEPTFTNMLRGKKCKADVFFKHIPLDDVPNDTDEECSQWLLNLYQQKDEIFDHYTKNGTFKTGKVHRIPKKYDDLIVWLIWAVVLGIPLTNYIIGLITSGSLILLSVTLLIAILAFIVTSVMIGKNDKISKYGE